MLFDLYSPTGQYDATFLANYAYINLNDQLTRVPGIGQRDGVRRRPVRDALLGQARSAGQTADHGPGDHQRDADAEHGQPRGADRRRAGAAGPGVHLRRARARPPDIAEQFGDVVVRANVDGSIVRLKDVARIELGAQNYNMSGRLNGKPAAISPSTSCPDSNASMLRRAQGR